MKLSLVIISLCCAILDAAKTVTTTEKKAPAPESVDNVAPLPGYVFTPTKTCREEFEAKKQAGCESEYTYDEEKDFLGAGFWGKVYKAVNKKTGKKVALKCKKKGTNSMMIKEYCKQKNAKHKYILEVYELTCEKDSPCIAMELASGGSLMGIAKKQKGNLFPEELAKKYFKEWAEAVAYMHSLGMANRDIKPDNVLLSGDTVKLCDFGIACYSRSPHHKYNCALNHLMGSFGFKPDERSTAFDLTPDARPRDVYALGMSWRELVTGTHPFFLQAFDSKKTRHRCDLSFELVDLIDHMIESDRKKRLTIEAVLQHPWMTGGKIKVDEKEREKYESRCKLLYEAKRRASDDIAVEREGLTGTSIRRRPADDINVERIAKDVDMQTAIKNLRTSKTI